MTTGRRDSWAMRLRLFWPRHARRTWAGKDVLPIRLAGTLPWVFRLHIALFVILAVFGLLFAAAAFPNSGERLDVIGAALMAIFGLYVTAISVGGIIHLRRSLSAVVRSDGVFPDPPPSGLWFQEVTGTASPPGDVQTIQCVELAKAVYDYDLIGGDINLAVPVRRWAIVLHGSQAPTVPGLSFGTTRTGRAQARITAEFLTTCFDATLLD